jgi:hydroxymethylglutaryl-CoA lyase
MSLGEVGALPPKATIREVGPRDGLQAESVFVPTKKKEELVKLLIASGVRRIEERA